MALERGEVAVKLRTAIRQGAYPPGTKLPSQRELGAQLGAAPNTVGEALKILAREGLVKVKEKSGATVLDPDTTSVQVDPATEAREALAQVQTKLRGMRRQLGTLEQQVSDALDRLTT
jgi:DNA-binding FadR family transcriptional regulator